MLNVSLESKLTRYAVAAGAALSVASNAKAGVIQTVFDTPQSLIGYNAYDLNADSANDFAFSAYGSLAGQAYFSPYFGGPQVLDVFSNSQWSIRTLGEGYVVGSSGDLFNWTPNGDTLGAGFYNSTDPVYIGLRLYTNGSVSFSFDANYGYAELKGFQLVGYAYETTVNTPITVTDLSVSGAPEPGTWETLALGAAALSAFGLRKRSKAA